MASWYEVFDARDALRDSRQQIGRILVLYACAVVALLALAPLVALRLDGGIWIALAALLALAVSGHHVLQAFRELRTVVGGLRLSFDEVVGDYGTYQISLAWRFVSRVEFDREGLLIVGLDTGGHRQRLRIPHTFPDYSALSHRLMEYAEAHKRPVFVDGQPWQLLDLFELYPFLRENLGEGV